MQYNREPCVSTSSPGPQSRSGSTSCGRSARGSSGTASPASAGAPRGWRRTGRSPSYRDLRAFRDDPHRDARRRDRDDEPARPPPPPVAAVDARDARHPAVHRPGRPVRLQPQRRPARLPAVARAATAPRAGSTAGPTPRSGRAGSRTPGRRASPWPTCSARSTTRSVARRTWPCWPPTARPYHYAGNGENPVFTFRLGRIQLASTGIYSLDRSLFRYVAPGRRRPPARPDPLDGQPRRRRTGRRLTETSRPATAS